MWKKSSRETFNPSQIILIVTIPVFLLFPFIIFLSVEGGIPETYASCDIFIFFSLHKLFILATTASCVFNTIHPNTNFINSNNMVMQRYYAENSLRLQQALLIIILQNLYLFFGLYMAFCTIFYIFYSNLFFCVRIHKYLARCQPKGNCMNRQRNCPCKRIG